MTKKGSFKGVFVTTVHYGNQSLVREGKILADSMTHKPGDRPKQELTVFL